MNAWPMMPSIELIPTTADPGPASRRCGEHRVGGQIDIDDLVPCRVVERADHIGADRARCVHESTDRTECRSGIRGSRVEGLCPGDVESQTDGRHVVGQADRFGRGGRRIGLEVPDRHWPADLGECLGAGAADAGRTAGDDHGGGWCDSGAIHDPETASYTGDWARAITDNAPPAGSATAAIRPGVAFVGGFSRRARSD
jgi:hypothetical protein